ISGVLSMDATGTVATFTPVVPLSNATQYTARLDMTLLSEDSQALAAPVTWTFTTQGSAPGVTAITPADGATGVLPTVAPTATFSKSMLSSTLGPSTVTLTKSGAGAPVTATVTYNDPTRTVTLTPGTALENDTAYVARIDGSVESSDGGTLGSAFTWSFTT